MPGKSNKAKHTGTEATITHWVVRWKMRFASANSPRWNAAASRGSNAVVTDCRTNVVAMV